MTALKAISYIPPEVWTFLILSKIFMWHPRRFFAYVDDLNKKLTKKGFALAFAVHLNSINKLCPQPHYQKIKRSLQLATVIKIKNNTNNNIK
jgi:hypothetical protein